MRMRSADFVWAIRAAAGGFWSSLKALERGGLHDSTIEDTISLQHLKKYLGWQRCHYKGYRARASSSAVNRMVESEVCGALYCSGLYTVLEKV